MSAIIWSALFFAFFGPSYAQTDKRNCTTAQNQTKICEDTAVETGYCCDAQPSGCCHFTPGVDWWQQWYFWLGSILFICLMVMCCRCVISRRRRPVRNNNPVFDDLPPQYQPGPMQIQISHIPLAYMAPPPDSEDKPEYDISNLPTYDEICQTSTTNENTTDCDATVPDNK